MDTIPQRELRNHISDVLRRAEAGQRFLVTVGGRPVAELGPPRRSRWVPRERLQEVVAGAGPTGLLADLRALPADLEDPFSA